MEAPSLTILALIAATSFALSFYGAAVGLVLGNLRLPLLVYYLPSTMGMATNLAISGLGAFTGTIRHAREGRISGRLFLLMGLPSVAGALLGALFLIKIDSLWAHVVIGTCLILSGYNLLRARTEKVEANPGLRPLRVVTEVGVGLGLGFLAAVTGMMLGSLRLPVMIRLLKADPALAVGTNMAIGCVTAGAGALGMGLGGGGVCLTTLLAVAPPTILGGYLGARCTGRLPRATLQRLIGATIALTGVAMAAEGLWKTILA